MMNVQTKEKMAMAAVHFGGPATRTALTALSVVGKIAAWVITLFIALMVADGFSTRFVPSNPTFHSAMPGIAIYGVALWTWWQSCRRLSRYIDQVTAMLRAHIFGEVQS